MIGLGTGLKNVAEFNSRAAIALGAVSFKGGSRELSFAQAAIASIREGRELTREQQQKLFNLVHRYRRYIFDQLVTEFAAFRAKGHDA